MGPTPIEPGSHHALSHDREDRQQVTVRVPMLGTCCGPGKARRAPAVGSGARGRGHVITQAHGPTWAPDEVSHWAGSAPPRGWRVQGKAGHGPLSLVVEVVATVAHPCVVGSTPPRRACARGQSGLRLRGTPDRYAPGLHPAATSGCADSAFARRVVHMRAAIWWRRGPVPRRSTGPHCRLRSCSRAGGARSWLTVRAHADRLMRQRDSLQARDGSWAAWAARRNGTGEMSLAPAGQPVYTGVAVAWSRSRPGRGVYFSVRTPSTS